MRDGKKSGEGPLNCAPRRGSSEILRVVSSTALDFLIKGAYLTCSRVVDFFRFIFCYGRCGGCIDDRRMP